VVWLSGGADRVDGDFDVATGPILEADRAGKAGRQFPMCLAFGCPRANGGPGYKVRCVLWNRHIQKFTPGWKTEVVGV
jgi:hypothetical protein